MVKKQKQNSNNMQRWFNLENIDSSSVLFAIKAAPLSQ